MEKKLLDFIGKNSPDGGFLQSVYWKKFQESVGRKAFDLAEKDENDDIIIHSHIISHELPMVGKYFYIPRGPVIYKIKHITQNFFDKLFNLAKNNNINWIRIEPNRKEDLNLIKENLPSACKIKKSAVDVQPKEILVIDITKNEEEILAEMKQKTRYNIRLAEKKGVKALVSREEKHVEKFLELVGITAKRDGITAHPENYYRKMFETIPSEVLKLYVAEYEGKTIAANLILFFGRTATYMHGASDDVHREAMAPYLLQWRAIRDAKYAGCERYDFGGVKIKNTTGKSWTGVTRFKTGFAPKSEPVEFPGCYDIILNPIKYSLYRVLQRIKKVIR